MLRRFAKRRKNETARLYRRTGCLSGHVLLNQKHEEGRIAQIVEEPEQLKAKKALHIECHAVAYAEFRASKNSRIFLKSVCFRW
jgi:hypothetical protein